MNKDPQALKAEILRLTREYSNIVHRQQLPALHPDRPDFLPGEMVIPYAGRVFDEREVEAAVSSTLDFWLTLGREGQAFESELAEILGVRSTVLVNSGSSANLVAFSSLTSHKLPANRRINPLDEVITVAAGFPTTVAPIIQAGAVPVFIDVNPLTANADCNQLELAYRPGKTKAVMMAHALGNPFDISSVLQFCRKNDLWLIEDNCDALGSLYSMNIELAESLELTHLIKLAETNAHPRIRIEKHPNGRQKLLTAPTGVWGDISTQSFYPPHHLTMGEGGAVNVVRQAALKVIVESFRDWGRDCWCASGVDNTCNKRFGWQLGELPEGYDHKYIYSHLGFNLKPLDPQAAIGREQLKKLSSFIQGRIDNWSYLRKQLAGLDNYFDFMLPTHSTGWNCDGNFSTDDSGNLTVPSWFGFMILVKPTAPFSRRELAQALDKAKIGNRMLFGGNLLRQPAFVQLRKDRPEALRTIGNLPGADRIMADAIFVGTYPGLTKKMLDYICDTIKYFSLNR
jgi:CDP-6-deoxy-D-xylo-4-hexulose-3-dehydrase